jgi:hypothetical protein
VKEHKQLTATETRNLEVEVLEALESVGGKGLVLRELRQFDSRPTLGGGAGTVLCKLDEFETALDLQAKGLVRSEWLTYMGPDVEVTRETYFIEDTGRLRLRLLKGE